MMFDGGCDDVMIAWRWWWQLTCCIPWQRVRGPSYNLTCLPIFLFRFYTMVQLFENAGTPILYWNWRGLGRLFFLVASFMLLMLDSFVVFRCHLCFRRCCHLAVLPRRSVPISCQGWSGAMTVNIFAWQPWRFGAWWPWRFGVVVAANILRGGCWYLVLCNWRTRL